MFILLYTISIGVSILQLVPRSPSFTILPFIIRNTKVQLQSITSAMMVLVSLLLALLSSVSGEDVELEEDRSSFRLSDALVRISLATSKRPSKEISLKASCTNLRT